MRLLMMKKRGEMSGPRKRMKGAIIVEVIMSMTIFVLMYQAASVSLSYSTALNLILRRDQVANNCLYLAMEYVSYLGYGSIKQTLYSDYSAWKTMGSADSIGLRDFFLSAEGIASVPAGITAQASCTNNPLLNMQIRVRRPTVSTLSLGQYAICPVNKRCYSEGAPPALPGSCDLEKYFFIMEIAYDSLSLSGTKNRRVVSYKTSTVHDCREKL